MKQIRSLILIILTLLLLCACKSDPVPTDNHDNRSTVFRGETIAFPDGWGLEMKPDISFAGGTLTAILRHQTGKNEYGAPIYETAPAYYTWNGETLVFSAFADDAPKSTGRTQTYPLSDGTTAAVTVMLDPAETYLTVTVSQDDTAHFTAHPADALGYDLSRDVGNMSGEVFTVLDVRAVSHGENTLYVILTTEGLCAFRPDGTEAFTIRDANDPTALLELSGELFYMMRKKDGSGSLRRVDLTAGKLSDTVEMPGEILPTTMAGAQPTFVGSDAGLFAYNGRGIYSISMTKSGGEDGGYQTEATLFLDWLESSIVFQLYNTKIALVDDTTVIVAETDSLDKDDFGTVSVYRMIPSDEIPQKEDVVIAKLSDSGLSAQAIIDFNRTSDTLRFVIRDYTVYPEDRRQIAFDTDIAAGDVPDIILMEDDQTDGTIVNTYEHSDLLCDLTPLLQADPDFHYDDLLSYVTKPYQIQGKFHMEQRLFPLFSQSSTVFAHTDIADAPLTPDAYLALAEAHLAASPDNAVLYISDSLFPVVGTLSEHYDIGSAMIRPYCSFDDGTLADLIAHSKALGNGFDYTGMENIDVNMLFRDQSLLFSEKWLPKTLYDYVITMKDLGAGTPDDYTAVGYPNNAGKHCVYHTSGQYFAITAASEYKAECIKLLRAHLDDMINYNGDRLPDYAMVYYRQDIDKQLAAYDGKTIVQEDRSTWIVTDAEAEAMPGVKLKITREWADAFCEMLDSVTRRIVRTRTPEAIFYEELRTNPDRSLEESLKIAASRVSIYLSEQFE